MPPPADPTPPPMEPPAPVAQAEMPPAVLQILKANCATCHTYGERDPIGWGSALDISRMVSADIIVPGRPEESRLHYRVAVKRDMPFGGIAGMPLPAEDAMILVEWIRTLDRPTVKPRTQEDILDLIARDQDQNRQNRNDFRYISFAHFVDEKRSPEEIKKAESVLKVVLNSLSQERVIADITALDPERSVFRFRLDDLGWNRQDWDRVIRHYPFCIRSNQNAHRQIYDRLQTESPFVRGDWFIATATKPPLYEELLDIPETVQELEDDLDIDIEDALNRRPTPRNVVRIGFRASGVSQHNRMMERHQIDNRGAYFWISYDFDSSVGRADLRENPLGPEAIDERNFRNTFVHQGGEVIWSLPNGLQAYMLADAAGNRIDVAPKNIVRDPRRQPGAVENGVSCFGCHGVTGMNRAKTYTEILDYAESHRNQFSNAELDNIRALYPRNSEEFINRDASRYLDAFLKAGGLPAEPGLTEWDDFIDIVGQYEGKVGLRGGATELGIDPQTAKILFDRGRNEDALPLEITAPLIARNDWVCRMREIVPTLAGRPQFCRNSFVEREVRDVCDAFED